MSTESTESTESTPAIALRLTRALAATGTQTRAAAVIEEMRAAVAANNIPCVDRGELRAALVALMPELDEVLPS
jgi:hypothetical protein